MIENNDNITYLNSLVKSLSFYCLGTGYRTTKEDTTSKQNNKKQCRGDYIHSRSLNHSYIHSFIQSFIHSFIVTVFINEEPIDYLPSSSSICPIKNNYLS